MNPLPRFCDFFTGKTNLLGEDANKTPGTRIVSLVIESRIIDGGGAKYGIQGKLIPASGQKIFQVGEVVNVLFKQDEPIVILGHTWRKAQFEEVPPVEVAVGDFQVVFGSTSIGPSFNTVIVISSTLQGDFGVDLTTDFGVPSGTNTAVRFCQNNPNIVVVTWEDFATFGNPVTRNFLVLRVSQSSTGKFTRKSPTEQFQIATDGPQITKIEASFITQFTVAEDEIEIRKLKFKGNFIWQDAEFLIKFSVDAQQIVTIISSLFSSLELPPEVFTAEETFGPNLRGIGAAERIFCVDGEAGPEVFMMVEGEFQISEPEPTTVTINTKVFDATGAIVDGVPLVLDLKNAPSGFVPADRFAFLRSKVFELHTPLYLINMTKKEIVFRTVKAVEEVEWTEYNSTTSFPAASGGVPFLRLDKTGPGNFPPINITQSIVFVNTQPDFVFAGFRITPPNTFLSEPWKTEITNTIVNDINVQFINTVFKLGLFPNVRDVPLGKTQGNFSSITSDPSPRLTQAGPSGNIGFLEVDDLKTPILEISEEGGVSTEKFTEWSGTSLTVFFTTAGGKDAAILKASERWVLIRESFPILFFLFDRKNNTLSEFGADAATNFDPGFTGSGMLISEDRLYFVGDFATSNSAKGLLRVTIDDEGKIAFTKTAEISEPKIVTFPVRDFFGGVGLTGTVFPRTLEARGNPSLV